MRLLILTVLFISNYSYSQVIIPKGTNTIKINSVGFRESAEALINAGFVIEKIDSSFYTIRTEFKSGTGKTSHIVFRFYIRLKDSLATVTGEWYNVGFIGTKLFGQEHTVENSTIKIENTWGSSKACFNDMNAFALSFNKSIEYSTSK